MDSEIIELMQTKIAFLERANVELSDVVFRQQQELQALGAQLRALGERLLAVQAHERAHVPEEERPPHY
jgi:uncharacterized coiled-coil protein SlyX